MHGFLNKNSKISSFCKKHWSNVKIYRFLTLVRGKCVQLRWHKLMFLLENHIFKPIPITEIFAKNIWTDGAKIEFFGYLTQPWKN